jgi:hypothetical protein
MMAPNGLGPESFDLLKEYLSSSGSTQKDILQLLAGFNNGIDCQPVHLEAAVLN